MSEYGLSMRMADGVEVLNTSNYGVAMKIYDGTPIGPASIGINYSTDPAALSQVEWVEINSGGNFLPTIDENSASFQNMCLRLSAGQWVNMPFLGNGNNYYNSSLGMTRQSYSYPNFKDEWRYWLAQIGVTPGYSAGHMTSVVVDGAANRLSGLFVMGLENNV